MNTKAITRATTKILTPHVGTMRRHAREEPVPKAPSKRTKPTAAHVWQRYLLSVVTAMTSAEGLWDRLQQDEKGWQGLVGGGPSNIPSARRIEKILRTNKVRFPAQKAARIHESRKREFDCIALYMRVAFADVHDKKKSVLDRRSMELDLAAMIQDELAGCGVAPKIARLMMYGCEETAQVIPVDSRWQSALAERGVEVTPADLTNEQRYRRVEDAIVDACRLLRVRPKDADGIAFGWLATENA
jgi:hypothetical protein